MRSTQARPTCPISWPARCAGCARCWHAADRSAPRGEDPRFTLWQAWHRSGLQRRWLAAVERGGPAGAQAGRDLDAVTALFDVAEQYVARTTGASLRGLVDHVRALVLADRRPRRPRPPTSGRTLLSAHAALGREWDLVVIAGLQEGLWPNTVPRGGVLGTQQLVDVLDGCRPTTGVSTRAPLLAEERRLLVAAMGRARSHVLVTAVDSDGGDEATLPSAFFAELAALATDPPPPRPDVEPVRAPRVLAPAALVGRLRAVVCAPDGRRGRRTRVPVRQRNWPGWPRPVCRAPTPRSGTARRPVSTDEPLWSGEDHVVTLSPSTLQTLTDCPLRWLVERHGGTDGRDLRSAIGSVRARAGRRPGQTPRRRCSPSWNGSGSSCRSNRSGIRPTSWPGTAP